jgi:hypothetical protein
MNRCLGAMNRASVLLLAALVVVAPLDAAPRKDRVNADLKAQLLGHITELSSDAYEGREPGTEGEAKTLRYLGRQWFDIGLQSGTNNPAHAWFAPVTIVAREPDGRRAAFTRKGRRVFSPPDAVLVYTSGKRSLIEGAPVLFVGSGKNPPARAELAGRVALLLDDEAGSTARQDALIAAGASAVMTVLSAERSLENVADRRQRLGYSLKNEAVGGDLEAFISAEALDRVLAGTGQTLASLKAVGETPDFVARALDLAVTLEATTREIRINTHNVIGKLAGKRPALGAVLVMAHWDHFGRCVPAPAEDQICNGAIDNASGLAVMTEVARRLARGSQLDRDVYFVATTGEELGLLGAHAFAENPPIPLKNIVAAFNIDSVALLPAGRPFAVVGQGMTQLDPQIAAAAKAAKRKLVPGTAANAYVQRQDGWALMHHDVPAVMISSSWSDLAAVERFFEGDYHRATDQLGAGIELGGAADDVNFLVELSRWFGDARRVSAAPK